MPFPFTFKLAVPGLATAEDTPRTMDQSSPRARPARPTNVHDRRPSPTPPTTRKRGWDPSLSEPSQSTATLASPNGYLMAPRQSADEFELEDMNIVDASDLPPPAKRRRTLAGSIVSTAVSAALIGTAVGLTVYRLWTGRGKESEQPPPEPQAPPPPYHEGEWNSVQKPRAIQVTPSTPIITPRRRKVRHGVGAASATRRQHLRPRPSVNHDTFNPVFSSQSPFSASTEEDPAVLVEEQMDWMGDKLSKLIQEGQRALRSEVVVQSEIKEDEIDDGSGVWEEDSGPSSYHGSLSRSASPRQRKRPRNGMTLVPPTTYSSRPSSASPRNARFEFGSLPAAGTSAQWRGDSFGSQRGTSEFGARSEMDEEGSWESQELRESMARARERVLAMRGAG